MTTGPSEQEPAKHSVVHGDKNCKQLKGSEL
jgi:hypothetical protein